MKILLTILFFFSLNSFAQLKPVTIDIPELDRAMTVEFSRGPFVLEESMMKMKWMHSRTRQLMNVDEEIEIKLIHLESKILAPDPEVHLDYVVDGQKMISRIFFTAGGKWQMKFKIKSGRKTYTKAINMFIENNNVFPKDTKSFPYVGKKAHGKVGLLGGTGCRRRWDFVDTHDSLHINDPYDLCGKYAMVSNRYHKWVDLSKYGDHVEKVMIYPVKGDGVLQKLQCTSDVEVYKLVQYEKCGGEGKVIAVCDRAGNSVSAETLGCKL